MSAEAGRSVIYDHESSQSIHTVAGATATLRTLFPTDFPRSVLDIGCGIGTWLRAACNLGAEDVLGIEGADLPPELLLVPPQRVRHVDLNEPLSLSRSFDLILCLEVAEHLEPESSATIVDTITAHGDLVLFSAAAPGQPGQHHVNCQWPSYWQALFNARGFACWDDVRWAIWDKSEIEPWYRQNLLRAVRDEDRAGSEPRIKPVLHPDMQPLWGDSYFQDDVKSIEKGVLPLHWYARAPFKAAGAKLRRKLVGRHRDASA